MAVCKRSVKAISSFFAGVCVCVCVGWGGGMGRKKGERQVVPGFCNYFSIGDCRPMVE